MQSAPPAHGILWEGRSPIDDAPIAALVTSGSANVKTGPMSTVWILRTDMAPNEAKKRGLDVSVCGHCPMSDGCYVNTFHAPRSVYDVYKAGRYEQVSISAFDRAAIRWGGYGDPAVLPPELVHACNARAHVDRLHAPVQGAVGGLDARRVHGERRDGRAGREAARAGLGYLPRGAARRLGPREHRALRVQATWYAVHRLQALRRGAARDLHPGPRPARERGSGRAASPSALA